MIDKVTEINGDKVVAVKNVTINEPYFQGHFPNHPIMPGVLQLEAIAQVAGIPQGTAISRYRYAVEKLGELLADQKDEAP